LFAAEDVAEPLQQRGFGGGVGVTGNAGPLALGESADVVDAVGLVGVVVGHQQRVEAFGAGGGGLLAELR
jgi:hypothetical protein